MSYQNQQTNSKTLDLARILLKMQQDPKVMQIPLQFMYLPVQVLAKQFTKLNNTHAYRIHYLGPRFPTTNYMHKKYAHNFNCPKIDLSQRYGYQNMLKYEVNMRKIVPSYFVNDRLRKNSQQKLFYRAFDGMNPSLQLKNEYIFNSNFQGGNLDCVIKLSPKQFDLFLRIDANARGHLQWFYFSIQNQSKRQKLKLNICNITKSHTLYDTGMKPYIFSKKQKQNGWKQSGVSLGFKKIPFRYQLLQYQCISPKNISCYTFEYEFLHQEDEVFFAYCIPYTYSQLLHQILQLPDSMVKKQILGKSLLGNNIPILHISNHNITQHKKNILITGRIHPGQTNGSYMLMGFIKYIVSNNAEQLLKKVNFIVIPMVNPDGVILGNTRTSASGRDLNRQYIYPNRQLCPEVWLVKQIATKIQNLFTVELYFDFHGHSRKKNTFFYGPSYSITQQKYYTSRMLPKLIEKYNNTFRYYSCSFSLKEDKKKTARATMLQQLDIPYAYTIQTSIGYYYDSEKLKTFQFNVNSWVSMGTSIGQGTKIFLLSLEQCQKVILKNRFLRYNKRNNSKDGCLKHKKIQSYLEDDIQQEENNKINQIQKKDETVIHKIIKQLQQQPEIIINKSTNQFNATNSRKNNNVSLFKGPKKISTQFDIDEILSSDSHDSTQDIDPHKLIQFTEFIQANISSNCKGRKQEEEQIVKKHNNCILRSHREILQQNKQYQATCYVSNNKRSVTSQNTRQKYWKNKKASLDLDPLISSKNKNKIHNTSDYKFIANMKEVEEPIKITNKLKNHTTTIRRKKIDHSFNQHSSKVFHQQMQEINIPKPSQFRHIQFNFDQLSCTNEKNRKNIRESFSFIPPKKQKINNNIIPAPFYNIKQHFKPKKYQVFWKTCTSKLFNNITVTTNRINPQNE